MTDWLNKTHVGDCRALLLEMAAAGVRVQTCITSPPYFGLRDYGCAGQIGLEASPAEYVEQMIAVFRRVRDLLADDGTLWLNLGDSYAGAPGGFQGKSGQRVSRTFTARIDHDKRGNGFKPKDLLGIPWRVALALQEDGWYLRSDIVWNKPNPMPESVEDRPTKAHEYIFLLAKSERYFYDSKAIREPATFAGPNSPESIKSPYGQGFTRTAKSGNKARRIADGSTGDRPADHLGRSIPWEGTTRNKRSVWTVSTTPFPGAHFATFPRELIEPCVLAGSRSGDAVLDPFMGSGTTGQVATDLGRNFIGCELNPKYVELHELRRTTIGMPI